MKCVGTIARFSWALGTTMALWGAGATTVSASDPSAARIPEGVRTAPWKSSTDSERGPEHALQLLTHRLGGWISDVEENPDGRYRLKDVTEWLFDRRSIVSDSFKVMGDGREVPTVRMIAFRHGARKELAVHIYFDDGLFADAALISDQEGVLRLDCDLIWPDGRTGQVRDIYVNEGDDWVLWFMYYARAGVVQKEPAFATVLRPEASGS